MEIEILIRYSRITFYTQRNNNSKIEQKETFYSTHISLKALAKKKKKFLHCNYFIIQIEYLIASIY